MVTAWDGQKFYQASSGAQFDVYTAAPMSGFIFSSNEGCFCQPKNADVTESLVTLSQTSQALDSAVTFSEFALVVNLLAFAGGTWFDYTPAWLDVQPTVLCIQGLTYIPGCLLPISETMGDPDITIDV